MAGVLFLSIAGVVGSDKSNSDGSASGVLTAAGSVAGDAGASGAATGDAGATTGAGAEAGSGSGSVILINLALSLVSGSCFASTGLSAGFFS